ncbi:MAG TPA: 16S rRNA (cytidine(1402)-2'-O)-methyltransferase [Thermodesulfovibrionales bacterium]|nr:16S rRNA (cytidine(1402)-2'-O)-methyltransferase [Thermodesulfovibrionales bacterium]
MKGTLYIVSTPVGNLEDITLRAIRILGEVDIIAAEDTRHSVKLLNHLGIRKPMISYWREKEQVRSDEITKRLHAGQSIALISDAGTPGISDPGAVLIKKAIEENIQIVSIPGPSAFVAALSVSGLPTDQFTFLGFLPSRTAQRQKFLREVYLEQRTLIFYEAPHRIVNTLLDMSHIFGERRSALVKEITKYHEDVVRGSITEIIEEVQKTTIAGEYVIIVEGWSGMIKSITEDVLSELHACMRKGLGRKEAVKRIAETFGLSKKELYKKSLDESAG